MSDITRRDFLKFALVSGALYGAGGLPDLAGRARAAGFPAPAGRVLVNVMLEGGPDLRHLLPPPFDPDPQSFGYRHWQARAGVHGITDAPAAWRARWENDYFTLEDAGTGFGMLRSCGWLKRMWDAGRVAIVCNVVGASSRNHAHAQLVLEQGDPDISVNDTERPGWGGRLVAASGGNVLSLTRSPRNFCYGPLAGEGTGRSGQRLVSAPDMRQFNLFRPSAEEASLSATSIMSRSLFSYYAALDRSGEAPAGIRGLLDMERSIRDLGDALDTRLAGEPLPPSLAALRAGEGINSAYFGLQTANLFDALLASDLLSLRVASLEYGGWDTHHSQRRRIERNLEDLFGDGRAFDLLYQELPGWLQDELVLVFGGEFGRQLRGNPDGGTDHGRGNYMLIVGNPVNGGLYGTPYPEEELARLGTKGADIEGRTDIDAVLAQVADFVAPGSAATVFPQAQTAQVEAGVSLDRLFV
ncbi:MAG TPA: DUF1501 domain-containing protein [Gammaproteobacteria bacterium]|nr:DUF1501 domain-containing protein [Gammaproteobacteria bacterium]